MKVNFGWQNWTNKNFTFALKLQVSLLDKLVSMQDVFLMMVKNLRSD